MMMTIEPLRWGSALLLSGAWLAMCANYLRAARLKSKASGAPADWLVVYASQTGSAEYLAKRSADLLATGGLAARAACISSLDDASLRGATRILFIASTYGEGDAPDTAARFAERLMADGADLAHLHYAVLALGDRSYANFCGFGRALDAWLAKAGATPLFERIDVDRGDAVALEHWQHHLARLAGTDDAPDWEAPAYGNWRIAERELLNPGSAGSPLYRLALAPVDTVLPEWEAGDLAQVSAPADPEHPREYSIASLPSDGRLELLVRLQRHEDGSPGAASGWLCEGASSDDAIRLRIREHQRFRLGDNARRPMLLIGNGSGLAGLRGLLRARVQLGVRENWLLFGERNAAHDFLLRGELEGWQSAGWLEKLDLAFSRDQDRRLYVQDMLRAQAVLVRQWVDHGAAIYVCGSLQGMAGGVHEALQEILGGGVVERLTAEGRYRRDVY
ncbi:Sulfite reductase [NADPH] flavoprotein alpha-component [Massilia sp. Bi118]|uniref:sulfite reductase subunit alpha n=1 Tax=Massilia sp. Bi118 TaxID=2822346 RepID=UPI001DC107B9|nr:sulfite reductase subunit alpha [Massilia sp. Bi118]CAH0313816.1 Sulfite reductase [NADPH] flavoprotein alpha-component [Massilia sp. Bi118]